MSFEQIKSRLHAGRPIVLDADTPASFRARGVALDVPGALGLLLRQNPDSVLDHYRAEINSRVDVLTTLTADTTPRTLAEVGMQHRASRLTSLAVDLAFEAAEDAPNPIAVAGVIGAEMVSPTASDRVREELEEHAQRLAVAGCELLVAKGLGSRLELMAAVVAAAGTDLPTWAVVEVGAEGELMTGGMVGPLLDSLEEAGATAILLEVPSIERGIEQLEKAQLSNAGRSAALGILLAGGNTSLRGFPDGASHPSRWADGALQLDKAGARLIGGGAGTTEAHTDALANVLRVAHPSIPVSTSSQ